MKNILLYWFKTKASKSVKKELIILLENLQNINMELYLAWQLVLIVSHIEKP